MDASKFTLSIINFTVLLLLSHAYGASLDVCKFDRIFQLGDSLSDTGNSIVEIPQAFHGRFPYGETIGKATGRPSDGYLMIDFIAQSAGLPLVEPYENPKSTLTYGVDFSVAGVTALSNAQLKAVNLDPGYSNSTFDVQLVWLKKHLSTFCNDTKDCQEKLKSTLFMVGTIGPNDVSRGMGKLSLSEINKNVVPVAVKTIKDGAQTVINYGASRLVVPNGYPQGCAPSFLTMFNSTVVDSFGCLKEYNDLFASFNDQLRVAVDELQKENPTVTIVYADLYSATFSIIKNFSALGFKTFNKACCGIGGKYNAEGGMDKMCGAKGVPFCPNPQEHVFWDGGHFTQHANKILSETLIAELLPKLKCQA